MLTFHSRHDKAGVKIFLDANATLPTGRHARHDLLLYWFFFFRALQKDESVVRQVTLDLVQSSRIENDQSTKLDASGRRPLVDAAYRSILPSTCGNGGPKERSIRPRCRSRLVGLRPRTSQILMHLPSPRLRNRNTTLYAIRRLGLDVHTTSWA